MSLCGRPAVSGKSALAIACHGADAASLGIDPPDNVVLHFNEEEVARPVQAHFVRFVEFRLFGRPAIAAIPLLAVADDGCNLPARVHAPDDVIKGVANKDDPVAILDNSERSVECGLGGGTMVAGIPFLARANRSVDCGGLNDSKGTKINYGKKMFHVQTLRFTSHSLKLVEYDSRCVDKLTVGKYS